MKIFHKIITLAFGIIFMLCSQLALAYQDNYQGKWWVNLGAGLGAIGNSDFEEFDGVFTDTISMNYMPTNTILLSIQTIQRHTVGFHSYQYAALVGLIRKREKGYIAAQIGLGLNQNTLEDFFETGSSSDYRVAIPVQVQAFYTPTHSFGIGIIGSASATSEMVTASAMLAIQFGNLV